LSTNESFLVDRFVIGIDVKKYSARSTRRQEDIQRELKALLGLAARAAGLDTDSWQRQGTGDGELVVLPPDVDLVRVVARFTPEINTLLKTHNADRVAEAQIRLRLAMHIDALKASDYWYAGPALVEVSRILDARPLRKALDEAEDSAVALIVSEVVYRKVVLSDLGGLRPEQFAKVDVDIPAKDFRQTAYVHVPGYDMRTFAVGQSAGANPPRKDAETARVVNHIDTLNAPGGYIGNAF
jgi:hypothetical protein